ncbi:MAG: tetratricopeptide repeat protein [Planctomycetota bacterium]
MPNRALSLSLVVASCIGWAGAQDPAPASQPSTPDPAWTKLLERAGKQFEAGEVATATALARDALAAANATLAPDDVRRTKPMLLLSSLLIMQGEHAAATEHAEQAHELALAQLVEARARVATTLKYLGAIYTQEDKLDDAQRVYQEAVTLSEVGSGPDHPETAKHVGNLGALLLRRGEREQAGEMLQRALDIWDQQGSPNPVYTVGAMCNLAELHLGQGQIEIGLQLYGDALTIQEAAFTASDPRVRNTRRRYARALRAAGREGEAAALEGR